MNNTIFGIGIVLTLGVYVYGLIIASRIASDNAKQLFMEGLGDNKNYLTPNEVLAKVIK